MNESVLYFLNRTEIYNPITQPKKMLGTDIAKQKSSPSLKGHSENKIVEKEPIISGMKNDVIINEMFFLI